MESNIQRITVSAVDPGFCAYFRYPDSVNGFFLHEFPHRIRDPDFRPFRHDPVLFRFFLQNLRYVVFSYSILLLSLSIFKSAWHDRLYSS